MNKIDFANMSIMPSSTPTILLAMGLAAAIGIFIYFVYRFNYRGVMFSNNFAVTLIMLTIVTTPVVMCIRDSIALSMGMVGALSIVRFRTALKDPLDLVYAFWALTMGIMLGAGQFFLAGVTAVLIAVILLATSRTTVKSADCYLLVVRCLPGADSQVLAQLKNIKHQKMRSKTATRQMIEMTIELRLDGKQDALVNRIISIDGVEDATLVSYVAEIV